MTCWEVRRRAIVSDYTVAACGFERLRRAKLGQLRRGAIGRARAEDAAA